MDGLVYAQHVAGLMVSSPLSQDQYRERIAEGKGGPARERLKEAGVQNSEARNTNRIENTTVRCRNSMSRFVAVCGCASGSSGADAASGYANCSSWAYRKAKRF